jgi:pimeloyl-ACP methyl ester carboxylesterase
MKPDEDDPLAFCHGEAQLGEHRWRYVDEGTGPLLLLLHGFPYTGYAYRKIIPTLVAAGYRVVVPDLLGCGGSDAPAGIEPYTHVRGVGDLVGLLQVLGEASSLVVGHDVGASLAFAAAQMRPDRFRALVLLNTPPTLRPATRPSRIWHDIHERTGGIFYQAYFASAAASAELDADVRRSLRSVMFSVSGDAKGEQRWRQVIAPHENFLDTVCSPLRGHREFAAITF